MPQIFHTIFVATGCDYISFFSEIGKATFLRYFYQHAEFIFSGKFNLPGTVQLDFVDSLSGQPKDGGRYQHQQERDLHVSRQ